MKTPEKWKVHQKFHELMHLLYFSTQSLFCETNFFEPCASASFELRVSIPPFHQNYIQGSSWDIVRDGGHWTWYQDYSGDDQESLILIS